MALQAQVNGWGTVTDPPKLTTQQWNLTGVLGVILVVMAVLQAIGFADFRDWLASIGLSSPAVWAGGLIAAELIAAVNMFKLRLPDGLRALSALLLVLVAGFWFVQNLRLISLGETARVDSSGFFGGFLNIQPGWWSVIAVTAFLFWALYSLHLTRWSR